MRKLIPDIYKTCESYRIDSVQRSILGGSSDENRTTTDVKKKLLDAGEQYYIYSIHILHRQQSNSEGIRKAENLSAMLWDGVLIETDRHGAITEVAFREETKAKQTGLISKIGKEVRHLDNAEEIIESINETYAHPEKLKSVFLETETGTLLFPPVYNSLDKADDRIEQEKVYHDFFGKVSLPLQLTATFKNWDIARDRINVSRQGKLNTELFDRREMARHFKTLADDLSLRAELSSLRYADTFDFDRWRWVIHAGQIFYVDVHNLFHYEQVVRVTPLPE